MNKNRLDEVLDYDPLTGVFTWKIARGRMPAGAVAGVKCDTGYTAIRVDGTRYLAHRLAWLTVVGRWPDEEIDHKNGRRSDNRILNLRDVSRAFNQQNQRKAQIDNRAELLGVSRSDSKTGYRSRIFVDGKQVHLGSFKTPGEAHSAYVDAKRDNHPGGTI